MQAAVPLTEPSSGGAFAGAVSSIHHPPGRRRTIRSDPWEAILIADADNSEQRQRLCREALLVEDDPSWTLEETLQELMEQVPVLDTQDLAVDPVPTEFGLKRVALLVDASAQHLLGYCLWVACSEDSDHFLWILHLAVLEAFRGQGLGRVLMRWVTSRAATMKARGIRLQSVDSAVPFYQAIGFQVRTALVTRTRGIPMEMHVLST
mmetsp:Transcript_72340/g.167622  ORF Transcript_72340/g.167622 Transcript_72340/m.167622 type:complete len:207 (+) Transcript_72340:1-621(+)